MNHIYGVLKPCFSVSNLTDAAGFFHPLAAAAVAEIIALWLERYLPNWRWSPLLLLALSLGIQCAAGAISGAMRSAEGAFLAAWNALLGASIATFGREVVLNILGLWEVGPRARASLRARSAEDRWV